MEMFQWQFELVMFWVVLSNFLKSLIDEVIVGIIMKNCK